MTPSEVYNRPILKTVTARLSNGQVRSYEVIGEGRLRFPWEPDDELYDAWVVNDWFKPGMPHLLLKSQVMETQEVPV